MGLTSVFLMVGYSIYISHRYAGPGVAILNYIERIKAGDLESDRELRKNDEFQAIMKALNGLAENLKNKSASN
jgi:nitrogen fixation/metabolism regulation signal transduction histidine kinase